MRGQAHVGLLLHQAHEPEGGAEALAPGAEQRPSTQTPAGVSAASPARADAQAEPGRAHHRQREAPGPPAGLPAQPWRVPGRPGASEPCQGRGEEAISVV